MECCNYGNKNHIVEQKNNPIELVGILPNQVRDIKLHKNFLEDLKNKREIGRICYATCD